MSYSCTWLPDVLRAAGLTVVLEPGWETRGHGDMGAVLGILCHHTGGPLVGDAPSLATVRDGRPDLSGPLSQLLLARSGAYHVIAAGKCYHAGEGVWDGITGGNTHFIGIEAENTGKPDDPWPEVQMDAYARGCAAILKHIGADEMMVAGHKEFALPHGRKIDPSFSLPDFRLRVLSFLK